MSSCDTYSPPHVEQLHGPDPTAGSDCAICCAKMAIRFATCGALDPSPDKIRGQAGLDEPDPPPDDYSTTIHEYARAVNAFDDEARDRGFDGIGAGVHERGRWDDLEPVLKDARKWITLLVDYGVLNDREPAKSGDKNFNGSHAISVYGYRSSAETDDGTVKFKVYDPLCDGRRPEIPKGPTWWKASTLRDAADAYAGGGEGTATWCTTPRSASSETPEPPDPCAVTATARGELLGEVRQWLTETGIGLELLERVSELLGGNPDAEGITVRSGVTPDQ